MSNIDDTLKERDSRYGDFINHARITQRIKADMVDSPNWAHLSFDMKEALEMVAHKIGRILNGDPDYIDSWTDIIGYTRLVEKKLIDRQDNSPVPSHLSGLQTDGIQTMQNRILKEMDRQQVSKEELYIADARDEQPRIRRG